jgi:hypothetical protein
MREDLQKRLDAAKSPRFVETLPRREGKAQGKRSPEALTKSLRA